MKRTAMLFLLALTTFFSINVFAANELTSINVTPNHEENQKSLSKITLHFMNASYGIDNNVDISGITLTGSDIVYYAMNPVVDYSKLTLEFGLKEATVPVEITEDGVYTLHVPAGAVVALNDLGTNAELSYDFTVESNATTEMSRYELTPAAGIVEELSEIAVNFPDCKNGLDWFYNNLYSKGDFSAITVSNKNNSAEVYTAKVKKVNLSSVVFDFVKSGTDEEMSLTEGTYVLHIPAGMFQSDMTYILNEEINEEYTIQAVEPEEPEDFKDMVSSPADGSTVGQLYSMSVSFPKMAEGLEWPVGNIGQISIKAPGDKTFYAFNAQLGSYGEGQYNRLVFNFGETGAQYITDAKLFTEEGEYEVTMPENTLKAYGKDVSNSEIKIKFTIDPLMNFTYNVTPEAGTVHNTFEDIVFTAGSSLTTLTFYAESEAKATISLGETVYELIAAQVDDKTVKLSVPEESETAEGVWKIKVPAGYLSGLNSKSITISNQEIELDYKIKNAETFGYTLNLNGEKIEFFKNVIVKFEGENLKGVEINPSVGQPAVKAESGESYNLNGTVNIHSVIFSAAEAKSLPNGNYTITIPEGYILTVDKDNLKAEVEEITTTFEIEKKEVNDYTDGILFLNEGWYGVDNGSLNFLSNNDEWTYDAFARNNTDHAMGITSQYGQCFGDKIYVVSKQGSPLTVIDAKTLKFEGEIAELPDANVTPYAFCAWDEHKGYLSTNKKTYVVDLDKLEITSFIPGTDQMTSFDSNGEMIRYGNYIYAIRQSSGVMVIDPETDKSVDKLSAELAVAFAVTPDGSLYVATQNENNEFIKIPTDGESDMTYFDIVDIDRAKIANIWSTWKKAPLAADITTNAVYYVNAKAPESGARVVSKYDFDKKEYTEEFVKLPGVEDGESGNWILYGEGVSVDPRTGFILLTAVEEGTGDHYKKNRVFVADPATGNIVSEKTYVLDDYFWFPAMTLYPDFEAPVINTDNFDFEGKESTFTLDVAAMTTLETGNAHLINYAVTASDEKCIVTPKADGVFEIAVGEDVDGYSLNIYADYNGKTATATLTKSADKTGVDETEADSLLMDVYNLQGVCVMRKATVNDIYTLPAGLYIAGGRKYFVR